MKRLFNNTIVTSVDYFILIALNLVATPILISNFGIDGYGAFVFLSIFSIYGFLLFFDLGMEGSVMNYVARFEVASENENLQDTLTISLVYYAVVGALLGVILYFTSGFVASRLLDDSSLLSRQSVLNSLSIIAVNIFLQFLTVPFSAVLQGMRRYVIAKSVNSALTIVRYLLIIIAAIQYHRIDLAFLIIAGLTVIRLIVYLYIFRFKLAPFQSYRIRLNWPLWRTLFSYSSILFISRIIGLICNQIDKILIWLYLAVSNMAIYDIVCRPAMILRVLIGIINSAVVPEVARLHQQNDKASIGKLFVNLVRYAYLILLPVVVVLYVFMKSILYFWVGNQFVPYSHLSLIPLSVYLILPLPSIASTMVVGMEKVKQTIWIPIVATVINIVLSLSLLAKYGLAGLLMATLVSELFAVLPYMNAMKRFLDFKPSVIYKKIAPIFAIALVFAAIHATINQVFEFEFMMTLVGILIVVTAHCFTSYKLLLEDHEKAFLGERYRLYKSRITSMRSSR